MQLSPHFSLEEFCVSQTAARLGLSNDPPLEVVSNLKRTAIGLERVRVLLNANAIHINSGYRSPKVNAAVGSKPTSQHVTGQAADIICPTFGTPERVMEVIVNSAVDYDQIILEFGSWVHISFTNGKPRQQALIIDNRGTRAYV